MGVVVNSMEVNALETFMEIKVFTSKEVNFSLICFEIFLF